MVSTSLAAVSRSARLQAAKATETCTPSIAFILSCLFHILLMLWYLHLLKRAAFQEAMRLSYCTPQLNGSARISEQLSGLLCREPAIVMSSRMYVTQTQDALIWKQQRCGEAAIAQTYCCLHTADQRLCKNFARALRTAMQSACKLWWIDGCTSLNNEMRDCGNKDVVKQLLLRPVIVVYIMNKCICFCFCSRGLFRGG